MWYRWLKGSCRRDAAALGEAVFLPVASQTRRSGGRSDRSCCSAGVAEERPASCCSGWEMGSRFLSGGQRAG